GIDGDDKEWSKNSHYYGLGLTYDVGAFNSNFMFELEDHKGTKLADGSPAKLDKTQYYTAGASYDFGAFTLYGAYQFVNHGTRMPNYNMIHLVDASSTATKPATEIPTKGVRQNAASVSVATPVAGGTLMLQLNGVKGKILNDSDKYQAWSIGSGYTYPLSKRTLLYGSVNYGQGGKALKHSNLDGFTTVFGMATTF
ncbi:porin, partial [Turicimonas muris]